MKQAVRMADIAQRMGISTVSVSKALAGKPGVSEELRSKIVVTAQEMGYAGLRLRRTSGVTGNIGILVADHLFSENFFYTELYRALVKTSGSKGYTCIVEIFSEQMKQDNVMPAFLTERKVDGVIFMGEVLQSYAEAVTASGLPCITLDFHIPGFAIDYVIRDDIGGGLALTEYLLAAGYRSIGFVGDVRNSYHGLTRYLGYQWALCRSGSAPPDGWRLECPEQIFQSAGFSKKLPDAFVCASEKLAVELTAALRAAGGHAAAVCFADDQVPAFGKTKFVSYKVDTEQMAEAAIRQILCRIRQEDGGPLNCVVSGQLILHK